MKGKKIVVVEDEEDIRELIEYHLQREGFTVIGVEDGERGLLTIERELPDLVLLDLMLPGIDGLEICRELRNREKTKHISVLMVTAKTEEADVVLGLGLGADDYIQKPFRPRELVARVKSAIRRKSFAEEEPSTVLKRGPLEIDSVKHRVVMIDGQERKELEFTATEFELLHVLARRPGRVFDREELMELSRGESGMALDRVIDAHIRSIRKKLGDQRGLIETVRSVGYRFTERP
ncbi:MAG: DNA-binding response OmpR family regulator [Bacteroidia bacterium]|jgi:DNA-binding response OmpR family regulator